MNGETKPFLDALATASFALPSRASLPALSLVKLESDSGKLSLTTDCLDASIRVCVPEIACKLAQPILVSPKLLKASLRGEEFKLATDGTKLTILSSGKSVIETATTDQFPKRREALPSHAVDAKSMIFGLKAAMNCLSTASDAIDGCVIYDSEIKCLIGADRKSFHFAKADLGVTTFALPRQNAGLILSAFDWEDELSVGLDKVLYLRSRSAEAWLSGGDVSIPRMGSFLTFDAPKLARVPLEGFSRALESIQPFVNPELPKIMVRTEKDRIFLCASHGGSESSVEIEGVQCDREAEFHTLVPAVTRPIRHWTSETITLYQSDRLMMKPDDESGSIAISCLIRP